MSDAPERIPDDVFPYRFKADPNIISPDEARWILGFFDLEGGEKPPGFRASLIATIAHADPGNLHLLALGFPGIVAAFLAQTDVAGLQTIAGSDRTTPSTYVCPHCGAISHNPTDKAERYCGACHRFAEVGH